VLIDADGNRIDVEVSSVTLRRGHRLIGVFGQIPQWTEEAAPTPHPQLTPRQTEILHHLQHGRSTAQIAAHLHLSPETVRNHVKHLLRALGVNSRLEAVALARQQAAVN
jgi:DNA-binding NarL/FixJ family response regulator